MNFVKRLLPRKKNITPKPQLESVQDYQEYILTNLALKYQRKIGKVYSELGIPAQRPRREIAPRYISVGVTLVSPSLHVELAMHKKTLKAIGVEVGLGDGRQDPPIVASLYGGMVVYQFRLPESVWIRGREVRLWRDVMYDHLPAPAIGLSLNNVPIRFMFTDSAPHALVSGATGSGKTELMKTIAYQLMIESDPQHLKVAFIDPNNWFDTFHNTAHLLWKPSHMSREHQAIIHHVYTEFTKRTTGEAGPRDEWARWVLFIDEAQKPDVIGDEKGMNRQWVTEITSGGRAFNINVVVGTQTPKKDYLGDVLANLANRYHGATANVKESGEIEGKLGLNKLAGRGDFLHVVGMEQARFQGALLQSHNYHRLPKVASVPSVLEMPEPIDIEDIRKSRGRPPIEIEGKYLEYFHWHGRHTKMPSQRETKEVLGIKRPTHLKYKTIVEEMLRYENYLNEHNGNWRDNL